MIRYIVFLLWVATWFYLGIGAVEAAYMPFELEEVKINAKHFLPNGADPLLTEGSRQNKEINLHLDVNVLRYGYINNRVWGLADQHQFRWIGLNYQYGVRVLPFLDIQAEHFSRHILDKTYPYKASGDRFPVEDSIGINLYLYTKQPRETLISW